VKLKKIFSRKNILIFLSVFFVLHIISFHYKRGELIQPTQKTDAHKAVQSLSENNTYISSQKDMDALGALAWYIVKNNQKKPGQFYVYFIPEMDLIEKFHHLAHQPFTGIESCYTDIWINTLTTYGIEEPSWGIPKMKATKADKFAILQILIDRLLRETSNIGEHFSCYIEIFDGMPVHTLKGRAKCYQFIFNVAKNDPTIKDWVLTQLQNRPYNYVSPVERKMWQVLNKNPSLETLNKLVAGKINGNDASGAFSESVVFEKLLDSITD